MKRSIEAILMCVLALALACGGEAYERGEDSESTITQDVWSEPGFGWQLDVSQGKRCNSNTTLMCYLPKNKDIHVWVDGTQMTASQKARTATAVLLWVGNLNAQLGHAGYTFRYNNSDTGNSDLRIVGRPGDVHRTTNNDRTNYVRVSCAKEGPILAESIIGAPGQYRKCLQMRAEIDFWMNDTKANALGVPQALLLSDSVGYAIAKAAGHGGDPDQLVINSMSVTPVDKFDGLGPRDVCRAEQYDPNEAQLLGVMTIVCG